MVGVRVSAGPSSGLWLGHLQVFFHWMVVCVVSQPHEVTDLRTDNDDTGSLWLSLPEGSGWEEASGRV